MYTNQVIAVIQIILRAYDTSKDPTEEPNVYSSSISMWFISNSKPITNTTVNTTSYTAVTPLTFSTSDTSHAISQITVFVPCKRMYFLPQPLGRSCNPNPTPPCAPPRALWARRSAHHVVSPPVVVSCLCTYCIWQCHKIQPAAFHLPYGMCQSASPSIPDVEGSSIIQ